LQAACARACCHGTLPTPSPPFPRSLWPAELPRTFGPKLVPYRLGRCLPCKGRVTERLRFILADDPKSRTGFRFIPVLLAQLPFCFEFGRPTYYGGSDGGSHPCRGGGESDEPGRLAGTKCMHMPVALACALSRRPRGTGRRRTARVTRVAAPGPWPPIMRPRRPMLCTAANCSANAAGFVCQGLASF